MMNAHVRDQFLAIAGTTGVLPAPHMTSAVVDSGGLQVTAGNVGIGQAPGVAAGLTVSGAILSGSTTQDGIVSDATLSSGATVLGRGIYTRARTAATVFTMAAAAGLYVDAMSKGAGSIVNDNYGLIVKAQSAGGTNNYGVYVEAPSGGSGANVGIFCAGLIQYTGFTAFVASDRYLVIDASGNIHRSALGPAS